MVDFQILPEGTTVNGVVVDAISEQPANVVESLTICKWADDGGVTVPFGNMVKAADGFVYFPKVGTGLAKITLSGTLIASGLATGFTCSKIVNGPDNRIWGTVPGTKQVIAYDPITGVSTTYTLTGMTNIFHNTVHPSIIVGADNNLWTVDNTSLKIIVFDTAGTLLAQHSLTFSVIGGLTLGADNRIFFASATHHVSAITTAGAVTDYTATNIVSPTEIFAASNSNLYLKVSNYAFVKLDTDCNVIAEYQLMPSIDSFALPGVNQNTAVEIAGCIYLTDTLGRIFSINLKTGLIRYFKSVSLSAPSNFACFDGQSLILTDRGSAYKVFLGGALQSALAIEGEPVSTLNPLPTYLSQTPKASYMASVTVAPGATPTDIVTIRPSNATGKTLKILRVEFSGVQTGASIGDWILLKRSTLNTGGTSSAVAAVPLNSLSPISGATIAAYTANPTLGTLIGNLVTSKVQTVASAATAISPRPVALFDQHNAGAPIVLRGTELLALNFAGAAKPAALEIDVTLYWTEE